MQPDLDNKPRRGRPPKHERAVEPERRRKRDGGVIGRRLGVADENLDFENFVYRFINDSPARLFNKTKQDDWDVVSNDGDVIEDTADAGNAVSRVVGAKPDGSPLLAYLCRKPKKFYEEDAARSQAELDKQLTELRRGNDRVGGSQSDYVSSITKIG